jgi:hypothetical protein
LYSDRDSGLADLKKKRRKKNNKHLALGISRREKARQPAPLSSSLTDIQQITYTPFSRFHDFRVYQETEQKRKNSYTTRSCSLSDSASVKAELVPV